MSIEEKTCGKCRYLDRYYTKEETRFNKTEFGWCMCKHSNVNIKEYVCEKYEIKKTTKIPSRRVQACLNDLIIEISEIRKILEAESGE
ncbi:MAG: hypothetical protein K2O04_05385 [Clostridiales bacterium]|nr:hypothetical protein [Clostridiales bacterium]